MFTHLPADRARGAFHGAMIGHIFGTALTKHTVTLSALSDALTPDSIALPSFPLTPDVRFYQSFFAKRPTAPLSTEELLPLFLQAYDEGPEEIGGQTNAVLQRVKQGTSPHIAKRQVWEEGGQQLAGSGGVKRALPALIFATQPNVMEEQTRRLCEFTHVDPRSVGAALFFVRFLRALLFERWTHPNHTTPLLISLAPTLEPALRVAHMLPPDTLSNSGYAVTAMQTSYRHFTQTDDFASCLLTTYAQGGDQGTLGLLAGAFAGAKYGQTQLPVAWTTAVPFSMTS
ncbi:MAG TPA: hypothetical protein DCE42_29775 [Myxococcales bacterium]|nr:hypothetical protein [Myxococcales bacterium]